MTISTFQTNLLTLNHLGSFLIFTSRFNGRRTPAPLFHFCSQYCTGPTNAENHTSMVQTILSPQNAHRRPGTLLQYTPSPTPFHTPYTVILKSNSLYWNIHLQGLSIYSRPIDSFKLYFFNSSSLQILQTKNIANNGPILLAKTPMKSHGQRP
ncbi:hypothetical protein PUMCH_004692 [Australozyma saopauloensis]|uniref:Uncharacterized protein n=1 Tax=Australozyma saopauloensis TaxID=291208 RepID=A0AAX4HFK0_9ASCO|nr:hypothetical protein PUMCH_004692 [[Candida] saopauloensis]